MLEASKYLDKYSKSVSLSCPSEIVIVLVPEEIPATGVVILSISPISQFPIVPLVSHSISNTPTPILLIVTALVFL